ncbi:uncharacterized protein LOC130899514 [Diorhabda carinulata]|uniref:uncharacterized protein LOC130899514 n=1 Tax=Diorhabda carinulata TaxID=1163345 RepID=UPI0025A30F32|nr:uncharacterized protein LOC130899514 [Diorhabda carinulata]
MGDRRGSLKPGFWSWDDYNNTLVFTNYDSIGQQRPQSTLFGNSEIAAVPIVPDTTFKDTFGSASQTRFRKNYERKVKINDTNVVILQDCKDVALFSCDVKCLTPEFIKFFHTKIVDKFLRSCIIYFQYYIQVWNLMLLRRIEASRKLRQPIVTELENIVRDDLADLRSMVARDYAAILTGVGDSKKFHHMCNENNVSLSDKDRKRFEMFVKMTVRVIWIALKKKNLTIIEKEMNRLLRTTIFSPMEHDKLKMYQFLATPEETRILRGKAYRKEKKLLHRSQLIQEIIFDVHDYRMLCIGVTDVEDRSERLDYLRMAYTAPEDLLEELEVGVGILGVPRKFLDPMLNEELMTTKKRSSVMKPVPDFMMPPQTPYDYTMLSETLPKIPCKYSESPVATKARQTQLKLWLNYIEDFELPTENTGVPTQISISQSPEEK